MITDVTLVGRLLISPPTSRGRPHTVAALLYLMFHLLSCSLLFGCYFTVIKWLQMDAGTNLELSRPSSQAPDRLGHVQVRVKAVFKIRPGAPWCHSWSILTFDVSPGATLMLRHVDTSNRCPHLGQQAYFQIGSTLELWPSDKDDGQVVVRTTTWLSTDLELGLEHSSVEGNLLSDLALTVRLD